MTITDAQHYLSASALFRLLRTDDIRRYLQDKKGEIKERTRRWSMCSDSSDCSVQSNSSIRSLPQYSSYRYPFVLFCFSNIVFFKEIENETH